jgi:hypothetical protein
MAQMQLLEGLLRRHARHRLILVVVADPAGLDADATWLLHHLPELLHDAAVTCRRPPRSPPCCARLRR